MNEKVKWNQLPLFVRILLIFFTVTQVLFLIDIILGIIYITSP